MNLLEKEITDKYIVEQLIPQKQPFVMVDGLFYFSADKVISGFTVPTDNLFVENNFFTAPGILEHMAQSVALHTGYQYYLKKEQAPTGYIGAVKKAEFMSLPKVASNLVTTVKILHEIMGVTLVRAETVLAGSVIARSEMKTVLVE
jgi:3-hydroxymyristoyl/3-hydroxydecanoyl-(acyl carrier protein) dehydratase